MSITDEFREWTRIHTVNCSDNRIALVAMAERIDAEHEKARWEQYARGVEDGIEARIEASMLKDHGYIELPKDADGQTIHFGDVLSQFGEPMYVFAMSDPDPDQGDCMLQIISESTGKSEWVRARKMRHANPDSWERIIEDAAKTSNGTFNPCWDEVRDALVERCKRLAGEEA